MGTVEPLCLEQDENTLRPHYDLTKQVGQTSLRFVESVYLRVPTKSE